MLFCRAFQQRSAAVIAVDGRTRGCQFCGSESKAQRFASGQAVNHDEALANGSLTLAQSDLYFQFRAFTTLKLRLPRTMNTGLG